MVEYRVICHHGIKGQKWGVRRYQNEDGTRTELGKKHERGGMSEKTKDTLKTVGKGVAIAAGTALAAYGAYKLGPKVLKEVPLDKLGDYAKKGKDKVTKILKDSTKNAAEGFKEGIKEGIHEAPKRLGKTVITGATMIAGKKILDKALGEKESNKVFKAANPKKISSFWNSGGDTNTGNQKDDD